MFGIGLPELILTLSLGLIFIRPKDIPNATYSVLKFIRKIKRMLKDINKSVEVFMAETELDNIGKDVVFVENDEDLNRATNKEGLDNE